VSKRHKIPDRKKANHIVGRSDAYRGFHVDAKVRHGKRLDAALADLSDCIAWGKAKGITIDVKNDGHHWQFRRDEKLVAQWWPSSAKFIYRSDFKNGIHAHGWDQVARLIGREMEA
jgi:hypothetical protein